MALIKIYQGKSKPANKKPGWQKEAAEHAEWLAKVNSMTSGIRSTWKGAALAKESERKKKLSPAEALAPLKAAFVTDQGTKAVARPEHLYRDDPEMLERERIARERKFNVAPAYNKGADQLVTEEELANLLRSNKRRS